MILLVNHVRLWLSRLCLFVMFYDLVMTLERMYSDLSDKYYYLTFIQTFREMRYPSLPDSV